jgi:hypothetical protein
MKSASPDVLPPPSEAFDRAFDQGDLAAAEHAAPLLLHGPAGRTIGVLTRLALLRRRKGQTASAIRAFLDAEAQAASARQPLPDWFLSELSGCRMDLRDWPAALETAEAGLAAKPALGLTMAAALLHLGRVEAARNRLRHTIQRLGPDPARSAHIASVCTQLLAADDGPEARAIIREAATLHAGSAAFGELRAAIAPLDDTAEAAGSLHAALLAKPDPGALQRLAARLRAMPEQAAAYDGVFEAAVLAMPDSEAMLFQWRDHLAARLTHDAITQRFIALQDRAPCILPAVALHLSRRMNFADLLHRFAAQTEAWRQTPAVAACQAYLDDVCRFEDPAPGVIEGLIATPELLLRTFFLLRRPMLRAIQVRNPSAADEAALRDAGVNVAAVQAFFQDLVGPLAPEWDAYLDDARFASPEAKRTVRLDEGFTAFQDRIVRDQDFAMIDPANGAPADLFDSLKIHDRQVFAFRGRELLTFHTGGNMNFALSLHLVRANILLLVDSKAAPSKQSFYGSAIYMAEVNAIWLRRAARNHAALLRAAGAARAARGSRRRIVAIHGRAENPAHHIWNYLPAFEQLALAGTLGNLAEIIPPPTHYFGPIPELFPELGAIRCRPLAEAAAIDPCPFDPGAIALQLGSSFIPAGLMRRVHRWAERTAPPDRRAEIERLGRRRPIIWVGLRVGDKMWVRQTEGIARIIDLIVPLYPDALFILDGFSLPDDAAAAPEKWRAAVADIQQAAQDILAATAHTGAVHSLVGNRLSESVLWARAATAYFTPLGSSQHKVGWYGDAQGLVYTSPILSKSPPASRQGAWEAEGSPLPHFLIGAIADPGRRRGNYDFRSNLENLDFEPHVAARRLLGILGAADLAEG